MPHKLHNDQQYDQKILTYGDKKILKLSQNNWFNGEVTTEQYLS